MLLGSGSIVNLDDITLGREAAAISSGKHLLSLPHKGIKFEDLERDLVIQALERTGGNQTKAGELLGMTRDQIHYRMEKFGLVKTESTS